MNTKKILCCMEKTYRKRRIRTGVVVKDSKEMYQKFKCNVLEELLLVILTRSVKIDYFTERGV